MVHLIQAFFLGMLQGLAEFFPISSSGHLAVTGFFFQWNQIFLFTIAVHFGTLCSLLVFYRSRCFLLIKNILSSPSENTFLKLATASMPVMLAGLFFYGAIKELFHNAYFISFSFIFTALFLLGTFFTQAADKKDSSESVDFMSISYSKAFLIGVVQVLALAPGVSRTGVTTGAGLYLGVPPRQALDFSFLLGIFSLFSACILEFMQNGSNTLFQWSFLVGFVSAFGFGYLALHWMREWVFKLYRFGFYLFPLGLVLFLYLYLK